MGTRGKFRLDFTSPPGELNYYIHSDSDHISHNMILGIFEGGWNLHDGTYVRVPTVLLVDLTQLDHYSALATIICCWG